MDMQQAFENICADAQKATPRYVSLYRTVRAYGGPEEGGWWYDVTVLEASKQVPSLTAAEALKAKIEIEAERLTSEARAEHGDWCLREIERLDALGIDDYDAHGSNDDAARFYVAVEAVAGSQDNTNEPRPVYC